MDDEKGVGDMKKEDLIRSASGLKAVPTDAAREYDEKQEQLVAKVNEAMLARADIHELPAASFPSSPLIELFPN